MFTTRTNFHHSKFPALGEIVTVQLNSSKFHRKDSTIFRPKLRKFIVEAFPMCDNALPYSIGIHTCYLRALDNNERVRVSGFLCID